MIEGKELEKNISIASSLGWTCNERGLFIMPPDHYEILRPQTVIGPGYIKPVWLKFTECDRWAKLIINYIQKEQSSYGRMFITYLLAEMDSCEYDEICFDLDGYELFDLIGFKPEQVVDAYIKMFKENPIDS